MVLFDLLELLCLAPLKLPDGYEPFQMILSL